MNNFQGIEFDNTTNYKAFVFTTTELESFLKIYWKNKMEHLTNKDFSIDQEVRWCPGCGDYNIKIHSKSTSSIRKKKRRFCIYLWYWMFSRFPYYMDTYGFHSIHGETPAL